MLRHVSRLLLKSSFSLWIRKAPSSTRSSKSLLFYNVHLRVCILLFKIFIISTLLFFAMRKYYYKQRGHSAITALLFYKIICVSHP